MKKVIIITSLALCALAASASFGASRESNPLQESCLDFVHNFYDWYVPPPSKQTKKRIEHSSDDVLKYKKNSLSKDLYSALKEDSVVAAKNPGELVGLEFDPILNAQDIAERYVLGKVIQKKKNDYWVEVYGYWNGKKNARPDVIPELAQVDGKWIFLNFYYPRDGGKIDNLKDVLKALKKERQGQKNK